MSCIFLTTNAYIHTCKKCIYKSLFKCIFYLSIVTLADVRNCTWIAFLNVCNKSVYIRVPVGSKIVSGKGECEYMSEWEWVCLLECKDLGYNWVNKKEQVKLRCLKQMEKSPQVLLIAALLSTWILCRKLQISYFTKFQVWGTNIPNFVTFKCKPSGKSRYMSSCRPDDRGSKIHSFQKYVWAHHVSGSGGRKWIKHNPSSSFKQDWLQNLWGLVQNANTEPVRKLGRISSQWQQSIIKPSPGLF